MLCPKCGEILNVIDKNDITCHRCQWKGTHKEVLALYEENTGKTYDILAGFEMGSANDMECDVERHRVGVVVEGMLGSYTHVTIEPHKEEEE